MTSDPSVSCPAPDTAETCDLAAVLESANEDRDNLIAANRTVLRERNEALAEIERLRALVEPSSPEGWRSNQEVALDYMRERDEARAALDRVLGAFDMAYKGPEDTDASMMREGAKRLAGGYEVGGSNMRAAVARLLRTTAAEIDVRAAVAGSPS